LTLGGVNEYLEDFVARIDAPLLNNLAIDFFHPQLFDTLRLTQFTSRALNFKTYNEARVVFSQFSKGFISVVVRVTLPRTSDGEIELAICCDEVWQLPSLAQLCSSFRQGPISVVEHLYITGNRTLPPDWPDDIERGQWLELFHAFPAVKGLHISREFVPRIAPALQELIGERVIEVLPALQTLFLEETLLLGPIQEIIGQFVAARQLASHPVAISNWDPRRAFSITHDCH
jgi:hypothetical protein